MIGFILAVILYLVPAQPVIYEQIDNTFTLSYQNIGKMRIETFYDEGAFIANSFDSGNITYTFLEADSIKRILITVEIGHDYWEFTPTIVPLFVKLMPMILNGDSNINSSGHPNMIYFPMILKP